MKKCLACGVEINNDRDFCKSCNQKKRNLRYYIKWINEIIDDMTTDKKEDRDIIIAS